MREINPNTESCKQRIPFIPNWLDDLELTPSEFRLYAHLCRRGECHSKIDTIGQKCGLKRVTICDLLSRLESKGLIERKRLRYGVCITPLAPDGAPNRTSAPDGAPNRTSAPDGAPNRTSGDPDGAPNRTRDGAPNRTYNVKVSSLEGFKRGGDPHLSATRRISIEKQIGRLTKLKDSGDATEEQLKTLADNLEIFDGVPKSDHNGFVDDFLESLPTHLEVESYGKAQAKNFLKSVVARFGESGFPVRVGQLVNVAKDRVRGVNALPFLGTPLE